MSRAVPLLQAPAPPSVPLAERMRTFFLQRWRGRLLLLAAALHTLGANGAPVPEGFLVLARMYLGVWCLVGAVRFARWSLRRLLWRIRTKLILSYLFIALVPVVLLTAFFLIAGLFGLGLGASYLVASQIEREGQGLQSAARDATAGLDAEAADAASALEQRLAGLRQTHPRLAYTLVQRGKVRAGRADGFTALPPWFKGPGLGGLVSVREDRLLRGVWSSGTGFLVLDVPVDEGLFDVLSTHTGVQVLWMGGEVRKTSKGLHIDMSGDADERRERRERLRTLAPDDARFPINFFAVAERVEWETGQETLEPLAIRFHPQTLVRRLSPRSMDIGHVFVTLLAVVGGLFLVMYSGALVLGLMLARSITRGIHDLSRGTERLRQGNFGQPIPITSRDQLGELAESFNLMAGSIEDLLREQSEKQRLEEELRIARQIQMSLLPQASVGMAGLSLAALCLPAAEVGGDYYDLLPLSETRLGVLVADVSGKGTSAALYMAELKGLVLSLSRIYHSPARLLAEANRILTAQIDSRSFITMTYAVVDVGARTLRFARAGHNPLIHLEAQSSRTRVLAPPGLGLGLDRSGRFEEILEEVEIPLHSGDLFLFFTDGVSEAMNAQAELFGETRLRDVVEGSGEGLGTEELKERILAEVRRFVGGAAQHDDMTLVLLKVV